MKFEGIKEGIKKLFTAKSLKELKNELEAVEDSIGTGKRK